VIPRRISLSVFCFAQLVIDAEVPYYILRGEERIHRGLHTYLGATAVALFALLVGRSLCQLVLRAWLSRPRAPFRRFFAASDRIRVSSALTGALVGAYSHVFLDSLVHADVQPFMPWSDWNPCYIPGSLVPVHVVCLLLGAAGVWYIARHPEKQV
jgi:hypothetical protein